MGQTYCRWESDYIKHSSSKEDIEEKTATAQRKPESSDSDYEVSSSEDSSTEEKTDESEMEETAAAR